ncbi:unnamed protein product [Larinioides sclopetarius]|uniref:TMC domain-containing protein n=1 Tax=Larinioides sclopetarius TaxID=280406 RepID=A0AAV1Z7Z1_9ARAC
MPLAFLWVFTISFIICLVMMVRYSSFGQDEAILIRQKATSFANEVFSAWDFCIKTPKAANIHHNTIVVTLKSELTEVRRKKELKERSFKAWLKLYSIRVLINILVIVWIAVCYILIYNVAAFQMNEQRKNKLLAAGFRTLMIQYLPPFTVTSISAVSPMFFNFLISFEKYHGQTEVNISLIRNVFVSLSSIIVLVNTFHREVTCTPKDVCGAGIGPNCKTPICWETYVGQQLYKLNLSQLFVIVASFVLVDVPRACLVKNCKLSKLIGHATFFLPTEVLVAIYSQTILWLGVFYSPLLPLVTVIKLIVLFYVKKTKVLKCSQQPKVLYKASRFNSTFINILLLSFFAVLAVHFYTLKNIRPSLGCTPFSHYNSMVNALRAAFQFLPFDIVFFFKLILSGWFFIPCSIILCTTIFYYQRHIEFLKDMEENLKTELTLLGQDKKFILQRIEALAKMM